MRALGRVPMYVVSCNDDARGLSILMQRRSERGTLVALYGTFLSVPSRGFSMVGRARLRSSFIV